MITNKIYKVVTGKKNKEILRQKRHKALKITTITAIGIGATVGATMVYRKAKAKQSKEYDDYMYNLENIDNDCNQEEENKLKEKIEEFNSNRLRYGNEKHPTVGELNKFVSNAKED